MIRRLSEGRSSTAGLALSASVHLGALCRAVFGSGAPVVLLFCGALPLLACNAPSEKSEAGRGVSEAPERPAGTEKKLAQRITPKEETKESQAPPPTCPSEMVQIPGGEFWVGTEREVYDREENPRFKARVPSFCVDRLEVSTNEYEACIGAGKCTEPHRGSVTCNSGKEGKGNHPINCIDHEQAQRVCGARGARLPTEIEWEYIARGGEEMLSFPWGEAEPDGHTCWKHPGSCERGSYPPEAFGLKDVVGNVWEWTDSWFAPYPWPAREGRHKVYRGGSWSRRFVKWMRPTLRNRLDPKGSGSHLGVRCALTLESEKCDPKLLGSGACPYEIIEVMCLDGHEWNGVRCARPGDESKCIPPAVDEPGYGCVAPRVKGAAGQELDLSAVSRTRSPEFDADCATNQPQRPIAYRYSGGEHVARNAVGKGHGCKNRDVGVGFNSACCPN